MKKQPIKRIGILTAGGDSPGLNAAIRAVGKAAIGEYGWEVIGFRDGFLGLALNRWVRLDKGRLAGILTVGGTVLGTSRDKPHRMEIGGRVRDMTSAIAANYRRLGLDALVCIGGGGTHKNALRLVEKGLHIITLPKTIDNDVALTDATIGFDTALGIATEALDRLHSTAHSHHRIIIAEIMGHRAGWLALGAGIAGGADVILIPEIPYDLAAIGAKIEERRADGKRFSIVVIAEGAKAVGGEVVVKRIVTDSSDPVRLGGVGFVLGSELERLTGNETRTVVLGHLQRGGSPTAYDRVLATQLGAEAVNLIVRGEFGRMAAVRGGEITSCPLETVSGGPRLIPLDHPLIAAARGLGTSFGDLK